MLSSEHGGLSEEQDAKIQHERSMNRVIENRVSLITTVFVVLWQGLLKSRRRKAVGSKGAGTGKFDQEKDERKQNRKNHKREEHDKQEQNEEQQ